MPMPVRSLPVFQNWDCGSCGDCCRSYHVRVTEPEKAIVEKQNWPADDLGGLTPIVWDKHLNSHRLNHRADGSCVFLGADNRCRIHAQHGAAAKPMACRIYPFVLVPAGDHWRVGLRFACPSSVANAGRKLADHEADCNAYAKLIEADQGGPVKDAPPPPLQAGQPISWDDLLRINVAVLALLVDKEAPIELRLRRVAALVAFCRPLRFDTVAGARLTDFLEVAVATATEEVPLDPSTVPPPAWIGRMIFRQVVAIYCRKDTGPTPGIATRGRLTRIHAAWRFARGNGPIPQLHGLMPPTTFEAAELPSGPRDADSEDLLARYFRVKVASLQFCGPTNFQRTYWDGLEDLLITFPAMAWLARVLASHDIHPRDEALALAVRIVDENFGYNPLLGAPRQTWAARNIADRGELARLIAWYGR